MKVGLHGEFCESKGTSVVANGSCWSVEPMVCGEKEWGVGGCERGKIWW